MLGGQDRLRVGERGEGRFELPDADERIVPPDFELAGDQAVVRIDSVVLALGTLRLIARFLQGQLQGPALLGVRAGQLVDRGQRGLDAHRLDHLDHLVRHGLFDGHASERETGGRTLSGATPGTGIARHPAAPAAVGDEQLAPASSTAQQAGQPRGASFAGARRRASPSGHVRLQDTLIREILVPRNVPRMVVADQDGPLLRGLPPAGRGRSDTLVLDHGLGGRPAIRQRTRVDRILDDLIEAMPGRQLPDDIAAARARPHVRQRDALIVIPQRRLPDGPERGCPKRSGKSVATPARL